jgi:hypothetical protein
MKQITVLATNYKNLIPSITSLMAENNVDIESITGESYNERSVVILCVKEYKKALLILSKIHGLEVVREDALLVKVKDELGALARLSKRFSDSGIEIRSIRFIERGHDYALVAISVERTKKAEELVKDILVS